MAIRYVKITQTDGARFTLRVISDTAVAVQGFEVDKDGEEIVPVGYENRLRVVPRDAIKTIVEMRMNNHYATLEIVP